MAAMAATQAVIGRWQVAMERAAAVAVAATPNMEVTMLDTANMEAVDQRDMVDVQAPTGVAVMVRRAATANTEEAEVSKADTEPPTLDTRPCSTVAAQMDMADTKGATKTIATISVVGADVSVAATKAETVVTKPIGTMQRPHTQLRAVRLRNHRFTGQ